MLALLFLILKLLFWVVVAIATLFVLFFLFIFLGLLLHGWPDYKDY